MAAAATTGAGAGFAAIDTAGCGDVASKAEGVGGTETAGFKLEMATVGVGSFFSGAEGAGFISGTELGVDLGSNFEADSIVLG